MIDLKDTCKLTLDKGSQRTKCFKFKVKELNNRELAAHQHVDYKGFSSITDVASGLKLCTVQKDISKITQDDIKEAVNTFIRHYTLEEVLKRLKELDEITEK